MKRALVAAMLSALATGAVLATVGFGANSTATTSKKKSSKSAQTTQSGPPKTMKQVYDEMQTRRAAQEKKLADALGVTRRPAHRPRRTRSSRTASTRR